MTDISQLFMYIPGIIIFLVGSGQVRRWLRMRQAEALVEAEVISCKSVIKKDKKGREIYHYYDVTVEYKNSTTKHWERLVIKSPTEYATAQRVRMYRPKGELQPVLAECEDEFLFHPWVMMIGGALLLVLVLEQNRGREIPAMICLTIIFLGAGINLLIDYISLKKRNLLMLEADIIDIYKRQISKETKILKGEKYTYYPVVQYELDGKRAIRRCNINSNGANTFRVGERMKLYYDPKQQLVLEKNARIGAALVGMALVFIGILAGASILSVII